MVMTGKKNLEKAPMNLSFSHNHGTHWGMFT